MKQTNSDAAFNVEVLQAQITVLRNKISEITATMTAGLKAARTRVQDEANAAAGAVRPAVGDAEVHRERAVQQRPLLSVLLAGLIGFLLGSMVRC
ncbi:MAG: hypothetical protein FJX64_07165 [Alphaproteobacteria bacterium]|nr:hypothetical protein [Alphaproteobacteria bacterium]